MAMESSATAKANAPGLGKTCACRPAWAAAVLISLAAAGIHVAFLTHAGGLWRDEVNTINLAGRHSLGEIANDSFPVLMPLTVRAWLAMGWGESDTVLRLLGVMVGLGLLAALWVAAWRGARSPPALSLVLVGLNPTVIVYGDSLRAFGLGSLLVVLSVAAMCAFLQTPSWNRAALVGATAVLSVQAAYQNAILVGAICIGGWAVCWRRQSWPAAAKILAVGLVAAASLLPYWPKVVPLLETSPASGVAYLRTEFRPALAFASLSTALGFPVAQFIYVWGLFSLVIIGHGVAAWRTPLASPGGRASAAEPPHLPLFAAATLLTALAGFAGFLWFARLRTEPWYFLPPMALAAVCFELGLTRLPRRWFAVYLAFVAVTALVAAPLALRGAQYRFTNVDLLAQQLAREASPDDLVIVTPWNRGISFERYFKAKTPWDTVPPLEDHSTHRYDLVQRQTQAKDPLGPLLGHIAAVLQSGHRVWVVGAMEIPRPGAPLPEPLPPPPLKYTGWSPGPYVRRWTSQTAQFLSNHSHQLVPVPGGPHELINANENLDLFVAEGWEHP